MWKHKFRNDNFMASATKGDLINFLFYCMACLFLWGASSILNHKLAVFETIIKRFNPAIRVVK